MTLQSLPWEMRLYNGYTCSGRQRGTDPAHSTQFLEIHLQAAFSGLSLSSSRCRNQADPDSAVDEHVIRSWNSREKTSSISSVFIERTQSYLMCARTGQQTGNSNNNGKKNKTAALLTSTVKQGYPPGQSHPLSPTQQKSHLWDQPCVSVSLKEGTRPALTQVIDIRQQLLSLVRAQKQYK